MPVFIIIIAVIAVAALGFVYMSSSSGMPDSQLTATDETAVAPTTETSFNQTETEFEVTNDSGLEAPVESETLETHSASAFRDGTFTAAATYLTPRRIPHEITVEMTVTAGVVASLEVLYDGDKTFANRQHQDFEADIYETVVGQELENLPVSRVGGASLTTRAFNEAMAEIQDAARS